MMLCCSRRIFVFALAFFASAVSLPAAEPKEDTSRGDRMLEAYFRAQTRHIADGCLAGITSKADWEKKRPQLHRQFLEMLGLWPLPARTPLKPVITGKVDADNFIIEKLHFQSRPGLYVTGNLYVPKKAKFPVPAVLYVCGHGNVVEKGVSYGSKVFYQHHPAWFAEHGYVCLVLDTLELGEIPGTHHGTCSLNMWWWQTLGYTPAGVECWNAMRALDYLETRKEVDAKRMGVTGRSGGGATSWWVGAADPRPKCIIPVAGIADLQAHLVEGGTPRFRKGVISGHCDCMYMVNTYRWDFPMVAALCAPRPLMLGNSDADLIFPVPGYRRLVQKTRRVYELYGASDKFTVLETAGPHKDTPELRRGAYRWMNRWLKGEAGDVAEKERKRFTPQQLKVLDRVPDDALNKSIHETFVKPKQIELPKTAKVQEWWEGKSKELLQGLRDKVFRGWPEKPVPLNVRPVQEVKHKGLRLRAFDFATEEGVELRLWLLTAEKVNRPKLLVLSAVDEAGWQEWSNDLGPAFQASLLLGKPPQLDEPKFEQNRKTLAAYQWGFACIAPRGIGPTRWAGEGAAGETHVRRRFALLGQTLDGQRVWDVRRAVAVLRRLSDLNKVPLWLQGKGDMAGIVLYAALFEPDVATLDLWQLPASHRQGPILLNVRRVLDTPQAVALAFPRSIRLYVKDDAEAKAWTWPLELQKLLRKEFIKIRRVGD
jgi:dienelactone hydrolase